VIVLAGVTAGTAEELARNTDLALAGIALARERGLGPVIVMSSAGVYGPRPGTRAEGDALEPGTAYGAAKRDMEAAVASLGAGDRVTCLRVANVAGCDALFAAAGRGRVTLDRFADGTGPSRAYIGPVTLARVLAALVAHAGPLPPVLNVAWPNPVAMVDVLAAAGVAHDWTPAPATALHHLALHTQALSRIVALPKVTPAAIVAEARAGGWSAAG
jgi:nucleoside-diphosphate-sugar epimerase